MGATSARRKPNRCRHRQRSAGELLSIERLHIIVGQEHTRQRRAILEKFRADHGDKRIALMHRTALQNILNGKTPIVARNWRKALRGFIDHCLSLDMIKIDPLAGLKLANLKKSGGHHTWTEEEVAQYENRHPSGSKARLALVLLLQTGHARSVFTAT